MKKIEDMTLRELVKTALRRCISFGAVLDCLYELERRLPEIEAAVALAEAADAIFFAPEGTPEIPAGTAMLPHDFIPRRNAYHSARDARTAGGKPVIDESEYGDEGYEEIDWSRADADHH